MTTLGTNVSKTVTGNSFTNSATSINIFGSLSTLYATVTLVGRDTGARIQIPFQLQKICRNAIKIKIKKTWLTELLHNLTQVI